MDTFGSDGPGRRRVRDASPASLRGSSVARTRRLDPPIDPFAPDSAAHPPEQQYGSYRGGRRLLGLALPVWGLAGLLSVALIGGLLIAPRIGLWAPDESSLDDGAGVVGTLDSTAPSAPSTPTPAAATTDPGGGADRTVAATPPPGPPALVLEVITSPNIVSGWLVVVTIKNPTTVAQPWTNVSIEVGAAPPRNVVESHTDGTRGYSSGSLACIEPTTSATIEPESALSVDLSIDLDVDLSQPRVRLNDGGCLSPA